MSGFGPRIIIPQRGDPDHFLNTLLNLSPVGGGGRGLFQKEFLQYTLTHTSGRRKRQGLNDWGKDRHFRPLSF